MDEVVKIVNDIKGGNIKPIYFLMGEEPYYIDKLSEYIEQNILSEDLHSKVSNQVSNRWCVFSREQFPPTLPRQLQIRKPCRRILIQKSFNSWTSLKLAF